MTHTYNITGMTCGGCVANVKGTLLKQAHILSADVQLNSPQATITMEKHIPVDELQKAIGTGKYMITEANNTIHHHETEIVSSDTSYYPIYLIFSYIAGVAMFIQIGKGQFDWMGWMQSFMGGFFLLFSFFKLLNLRGFAEGYSTYDIIAKKFPKYGYVYAFIELGLGIAYIIGFQPVITNLVTLLIMGVSSIGVMQSLLKKVHFQCACLGTIIKLPLSKVTLFEDTLMVLMSLFMLLKLNGIV